jgi:hypothetical protein
MMIAQTRKIRVTRAGAPGVLLTLRWMLFAAAWTLGAVVACGGNEAPWSNGGGSGSGGGAGNGGGVGEGTSSGSTAGNCTVSCTVDQECSTGCGAPPQPGYNWCCSSALSRCYGWSTTCPATGGAGSSSGGSGGRSGSGSSSGAVDAGRGGVGRGGSGGRCASPDTPIATPDGDRPIADIRVGDIVYSVDHDAVRPVVVLRVGKVLVAHHHVVHVRLTDGRTVDMSPHHPTADGRAFSDLLPGGTLDGQQIQSVDLIAYTHDATYDILPASDTGTYFAAGLQVGSTLAAGGSAEER